jgi:hypothetical protein
MQKLSELFPEVLKAQPAPSVSFAEVSLQLDHGPRLSFSRVGQDAVSIQLKDDSGRALAGAALLDRQDFVRLLLRLRTLVSRG